MSASTAKKTAFPASGKGKAKTTAAQTDFVPLSRYESYRESLTLIQEIETARYHLQQEQDIARNRAVAELKATYGSCHRGMAQFVSTDIMVPGASFLLIKPRGQNGSTSYGARLELTLIKLSVVDNELVAIDDEGKLLGCAGAKSFAWSYDDDKTSKAKIWQDPYFNDIMLLPLAGMPMLEKHGRMRQVAAYGQAILAGDNALWTELGEFNAIADELEREQQKLERHCRADACDAAQATALQASHPELAQLMRAMDWTYDYADRPSQHSREMEAKIRSGLNGLQLDDALALFFACNPHFAIRYARSYLQRHPEVIALEAAKDAKDGKPKAGSRQSQIYA